MTNLTDLLYEATDGDPNRALDPAELVREGHRRVSRRRGLVAVGSVVAAVLVIVGAAGWLSGMSTDSEPPPGNGQPPVAGGDSHTKQVEVSRAEVERRCTTVWRNFYGPGIPPIELPKDDLGPWFEGDEVKVANWSDFDYAPLEEPLYGDDCVVPQAGLEDTAGTVELPLPTSDDEAGVRTTCGGWLGTDFSDWQVVAADSHDGRLAALLRSPDERLANCQLDSWYMNDRGVVDLDKLYADPYSGNIPFVEFTTEAELRGDNAGFDDYQVHPSFQLGCQREPPGQWVADCLGVGWLSGPEPATRIVITDVTGAEHEIPVVDHWWAFAGTVINHAAIPEGGCPPPPNVCDGSPGELHFTVYAADGTILAEYDEDKDLPLIT